MGDVTKNRKISILCKPCQESFEEKSFAIHLETLEHRQNIGESIEDKVSISHMSFGNQVITYRLTEEGHLDVKAFMNNIKNKIIRLLKIQLQIHEMLKIYIRLFGKYYWSAKKEFDIKSFNTEIEILDENSYLIEIIDEFTSILEIQNNQLNDYKSGCYFSKLLYCELNIAKHNLRDNLDEYESSYIEGNIPEKCRGAILDIKNSGKMSFVYCIMAQLYPHQHQQYQELTKKFVLKGLKFPLAPKDISKFENKNKNVSINVYGIKQNMDEYEIVGPLYYTKHENRENHVNLLLIAPFKKYHYYLITDMNKLLGDDQHQKLICDGCLILFDQNEKSKLQAHVQNKDCNRICTELPSSIKKRTNLFGESYPDNILKFTNHHRQLDLPFVIYANFECLEQNVNHNVNKSYKQFIPYGFAYYIKCNYNDSLSKFQHYRGEDCATIFLKELTDDCKWIYIHYTNGSIDNYKPPNFIPIFIHDLKSKSFFEDILTKDNKKIDVVLPYTDGKYFSFTKTVNIYENVSEEPVYFNLRFLDSCLFMKSSLYDLAKNLLENESFERFHTMRKFFTEEEILCITEQNSVLPYKYVNTFEKFDETSLPPPETFDCDSREKYQHAKQLWNLFNCANLGEYYDINLKWDVILLCDIFENLRKKSKEHYNLDPAHYYTVAGLSWDAMLKHINRDIELLTDIDVINFIKKSIRGGISQCSKRLSTANNKFMKNFDSAKPSSYIVYLDATNLYGAAMSESLPIGKFEWIENFENFDVELIADNAEFGYILEVDLHYSDCLHDQHNDLPFCAESMVPPNSKTNDKKKLIPNLYDKKKYIIHYRHLKQALNNGLELVKIHRILKFQQDAWLKGYIDLNSKLREAAKTKFEKEFYKLMNNVIYGKSFENVDKRKDVRLVTDWRNEKIQNNALTFKSFCKNHVGIDLDKFKLRYDKPIYVAFTILEISKVIMYKFFYEEIKAKYGKNATLLYTDTDSLVMEIFTENFYSDMKTNLDKYDISNFSREQLEKHNIPQQADYRIGKMKDEYGGRIIYEFIGTGAKSYMVNCEGELTRKAAGVPRHISQKLTREEYFLAATRKGHQIRKNNRVVLCYYDNKRYILPDSSTLAWGHKNIAHEETNV